MIWANIIGGWWNVSYKNASGCTHTTSLFLQQTENITTIKYLSSLKKTIIIKIPANPPGTIIAHLQPQVHRWKDMGSKQMFKAYLHCFVLFFIMLFCGIFETLQLIPDLCNIYNKTDDTMTLSSSAVIT